jgi:hypothetical protein
MFCHLKPWQSWQVTFFHLYQGIQIKNPFNEILCLIFYLGPPKVHNNT